MTSIEKTKQVQQIQQVQQVQLVGHKIRQLRKERNLTQVELSHRLGIQQSDLSRMEQGEYRVSLDTLFRILAEFKMSIGEFFEGVGQSQAAHRGEQLLHEFNALPQDAQREVEDFIAWKRTQTRRAAVPTQGEGTARTASDQINELDARQEKAKVGMPPA